MAGTGDTVKKALQVLQDNRSRRGEHPLPDLDSFDARQIEAIGYSTSAEDAMEIVRSVYKYNIKEYEYDEIEKEIS